MMTKTNSLSSWLVATFLVLQGGVINAQADEWQEASAVVEQTTDAVLQVLAENEQYALEQVTPAIDQILTPMVDFRTIAKSVMAKYYRRAKPEQFENFVEVFHQSLIRTYAKAVVTFEIDSFKLQNNSGTDSRQLREKIWVKVYASNSVYDIHYTMSAKSGQWKVTNVVLDGVNLGLAFRNQFASSMRQHGNDIEAVIANWNLGTSKN